VNHSRETRPTAAVETEDVGPVPLGRTLVRASLVSLVVLGAATGWGAWRGLRRGLDELAAQGYDDLGFQRGRALVVREPTDHGALGGAEHVLPCIVFALALLVLVPWVRALTRPRRLVEALADDVTRLRLQLAWAVVLIGGSYAFAYFGEPLLKAELAWLGLLAVASGLVLEFVGRRARDVERRRDPAFQERAAALVATLLPFTLVLFDVDQRRVYKPFALDTWLASTVVVAAAAATYWIARRSVAHELEPRRVARLPLAVRAALLLVVATAALPLGVRAAYREPEQPALASAKDWNVVLIGIDTLRADHTTLLEPKPGERDRTPNLRKLVQRGTVFTQGTSQSPWTMPAFASIMTGKYPMQHGAISLVGKLRAREVTLAEILRETGRVTGGFVSHDYVDHKHGFAQGFDDFSDFWAQGHAVIGGSHITDQALEFVARHAHEPFFLFTHYFDPHNEYHEHPEWDWADGYHGWLRDQLDMENIRFNRQMLGTPELDYVRSVYDEEIAFDDREIGRLVADFEKRGLMEKTVFVLVADHGEEFLDHGNFSHTTSLFDELVHVPLAVVVPGAPPKRVVDEVVETRRVFATILDTLGVEFGRDARAPGLLASAASEDAQHAAFSMVWLPDAKPQWGKKFKIASVRTKRFKLVKDYTRDVTELFDLQADPSEARDASQDAPEHRKELELAVDAWVAEMQKSAGEVPLMELDDATRERLHELGYM
jgi:arylsulfatase A-like enzyme